MEISYNRSNPYYFTYAFSEGFEEYADSFMTLPFSPYHTTYWVFTSLIFRHLKNVSMQFVSNREIRQRLSNVTGIDEPTHDKMINLAIDHGIIDSVVTFFSLAETAPLKKHVPPIAFFNSYVIVSSVRSDSRMESSKTLSFQGLPSSVWGLVCFSLLVVSGLATYLIFATEKKNRREKPFNSWTNNVWIYAADILNNCVAGAIRPGPGRVLRSWWLLGVVFLIQFWSAGMKSDLLVDRASFIDSLEDLMSKSELLCLLWKDSEEPFLVMEDDPRYRDYQKMKKRYVDNLYDGSSLAILSSGKGVMLFQDYYVTIPFADLFEKLKETKRKRYIGKKRYRGFYNFMQFNKGLPQGMKEDIDYLTSRLTETRQTVPKLRRDKFQSRESIFDPTEKSASTMSWSPQSVPFMWPVFRMWIIGMSLATFVLCVEFFRSRGSRRRPVKVSPHNSIGTWIRA